MRIRHAMNIKEWEVLNPHSPEGCEDRMQDPSSVQPKMAPSVILPRSFQACTIAQDCYHGHAIKSEYGQMCATFLDAEGGHFRIAHDLFQVCGCRRSGYGSSYGYDFLS